MNCLLSEYMYVEYIQYIFLWVIIRSSYLMHNNNVVLFGMNV